MKFTKTSQCGIFPRPFLTHFCRASTAAEGLLRCAEFVEPLIDPNNPAPPIRSKMQIEIRVIEKENIKN